MKKSVLLFFLVSCTELFAQVQFDKQIQFTGSGADAKVTGIQAVSANTDAANKIYVDTAIANRSPWLLSGTNIYNNNSGNVGIGTTNPVSGLHIANKGTVGNVALKITETTHAGIELRSSGNNATFIDFTPNSSNDAGTGTPDFGGRLGFNEVGTNCFAFSGGGNVGIGTTNPLLKLHVMGDRRLDSPNRDKIWFDGNTGADPHTILDNSGKGIRFYSNGGAGTIMHMNPVNGNVGIGTASPGQKLHVVGNICYTGSISTCSDMRYKKNIVPLHDALSNILQMRGVNYYLKTEEYPEQQFSKEKQVGIIAQEVEKFYPELVMKDDKGFLSVDYSRLTPLLIEAIKEQQEIINNLRAELDSRITRLEQASLARAEK